MLGANTTNPPGAFLVYGAGGYSGSLIARAAVTAGLSPVLAGRSARTIEPLAAELGLEYRVAALGDTAALDRVMRDVAVVLHCAGPFSSTAPPMLEACLRAGAHYLDLTGETAVVEMLAAQGRRAYKRGIMAMAGVGLDVVAGDCLARHTAARVAQPVRLAIAVHGLRSVSRGTARTILAGAGTGHARREGRLTNVPMGSIERCFDFGWGPTACFNISWADVAAVWYSTGIPTIDVFCEATLQLRLLAASNRTIGPMLATDPWQAWMNAHVDLLPPGPDAETRRLSTAVFAVEVDDRNGRRAVSRMTTPEAYTFTAAVAPAIVRRVLDGDFEPGFQTPARIYGADLPLSVDGVVREDVS